MTIISCVFVLINFANPYSSVTWSVMLFRFFYINSGITLKMISLKQSWYSCSLSISQLSHIQKMVIYCTSSKVVLHIASISLDGHRDKIWWLDIYGNVIKNTIICPSNFNTKHLLVLLCYLLCGTVTAIVGMYSVSHTCPN